jgi:hypothetical protein
MVVPIVHCTYQFEKNRKLNPHPDHLNIYISVIITFSSVLDILILFFCFYIRVIFLYSFLSLANPLSHIRVHLELENLFD